ncbi:MAG: hypothetical protein BWY63_02557 [Chloroflexi bacterium ADurb.Bin360]|nr:MAG: hypothetical protein BWY63_02557 [Chloroflexi bacterium ADurb.Bin360]
MLAEGAGLRLRDVGVWRSFSDASVQWWTPQAGNPPGGFEADNNNRVYVGASGEGFAAGAEYAMVYPETGVDLGAEIARLFATVLFEIAAGDWIAEIRQADGTVLWTASTSMAQAYQLFLDTPTGGTFKLGDGDSIETGALAYNASAAAIETALRSAYSDAGITVVADADFLITFPTGNAGNFQITDDALTYATTGAATCTQQAVDGVELDLTVADTGLVLALRKGSAGDGTAYVRLTGVVVQTLANATNSQVAEEILDTAELDGGAITESDLLANRAVWQKESRLQALQDMAQLGDGEASWLFAVYEAPQFGPWPTEANWELRRDDLSRWKVTWRRDAVRNAVRARLADGWMSDWLEDADSIARWGRREEVLELGDTTQAEALSLAQVYLAEKAEALAGLSLESDAYCRTPDGAIHSGYLMRAGDLVRLRDLIPDQDLLIRVAETRATAAGVEVIPAGQDDRLETILAVQEQQLQKAATQALAASGGGGGNTITGATTVHDPVTLGVGSAAELTLSGQVLTLAEMLTPGEHTAIGDGSPHHAAVTLNAAADTLLSLSGQQLGVDAQAANMVYAGPASGVAATPTFRALGASDLALYWTGTGIDDIGVTVIANDAGDVTKVLTVQYAVSEVTGTQRGGGVATLEPGGNVVLCDDGTDELTLTCAVDGSVTLARTAGTDTFSAALWMVWL